MCQMRKEYLENTCDVSPIGDVFCRNTENQSFIFERRIWQEGLNQELWLTFQSISKAIHSESRKFLKQLSRTRFFTGLKIPPFSPLLRDREE